MAALAEPADDDPVARAILDLIEALPPGRSISPVEAARSFARARARSAQSDARSDGRSDGWADAWRRYLPAVRQQALY